MTIRVTSTRGASRIEYRTKGRYVSFPTTGMTGDLPGQPIQPTASLSAFWGSVLAAVAAAVDQPA